MKKSVKWIVVILVVAVLAGMGLRALSARKAQQATQAAASATRAQPVVELAAADLITLAPQALSQGLPMSGTLRALQTAVVKARVAGELQGLQVREGDAVKAGQVIARIDPTEYTARVRQAQESADAARAQIDIAQRAFDNNKALVNQGFISRTALDTSVNNLAAAQANHKAALAAVDVAKKALDDTVLRAPISGQVSLRVAQNGERVAVDGRVVELIDASRLELEAQLAPADAIDVRIGQQATLTIEGAARTVNARVARINPGTQAGSRAVLAYLALDDANGLRHGMFAQGTLGTARVQALALPLTAVRTDKPRPYVQVVENQAVRHIEVRTGTRGQVNGESMVAIEGLTAGAQVIAGSAGALREGTTVRMTAPRAAAPSPAASR